MKKLLLLFICPFKLNNNKNNQKTMKKILHLDATPANFLFLEAALKNLDVELVNLVHLEEIKDALKLEAFDLIISNTHLIPGEEIIRNLRQGVFGDLNKEAPALAYTSLGFLNDEEKCISAGFNEYILMPSPIELIKEKVEKLLE